MSELVIVSAGTGDPSTTRMLGDRLAAATVAELAAGGRQVRVTAIELRTLATDLVNLLNTHVPSRAVREAFDAVRRADGVIAVTPVYNGSYSGLFKLFFDLLDQGVMAGRPVLAAATGGTARHSLVIEHALLPLFFYLKAPVAPRGVFAATADWGDSSALEERVVVAAAAFAKLVAASDVDKDDPDFAVTDFTDLLNG